MKNLILALFVLSGSVLMAQDKIELRNGEVIEVKVIEILPEQVRLKRFEDPDGPVILMEKEKIRTIYFENGNKVEINPKVESAPSSNPSIETETQSTQSQQSSSSSSEKRSSRSGLSSGNDFHLMLGASIIQGDETDFYKTGFYGGIENTYYFVPNIGIALHVNGIFNAFDDETVTGGLFSVYAQGGLQARFGNRAAMGYVLVLGGISWATITGDLSEFVEPETTFVLTGGAGIILGDLFDIGIRYSNEPEFDFNILRAGIGFHF